MSRGYTIVRDFIHALGTVAKLSCCNGVQRRIRAIMSLPAPERTVQLRLLAQEWGCSLRTYDGNEDVHFDEELIRRIYEAARSVRESRMWWIAVISAAASAFSALAAWSAVLSKW